MSLDILVKILILMSDTYPWPWGSLGKHTNLSWPIRWMMTFFVRSRYFVSILWTRPNQLPWLRLRFSCYHHNLLPTKSILRGSSYPSPTFLPSSSFSKNPWDVSLAFVLDLPTGSLLIFASLPSGPGRKRSVHRDKAKDKVSNASFTSTLRY